MDANRLGQVAASESERPSIGEAVLVIASFKVHSTPFELLSSSVTLGSEPSVPLDSVCDKPQCARSSW